MHATNISEATNTSLIFQMSKILLETSKNKNVKNEQNNYYKTSIY